jgi:adenylate cyclase
MSSRVKRRLTTVLCADVAGYARLMEADEAGTLATLRRFRASMATLVERHDGRVVNTWGDAVLAEFPSVVEAVQCAVEIQQELTTENGPLPEFKRMQFRIGINVGDVMVEGDDIYGEGVNIAARLQDIAEPGGILVSGSVYDQVHNKLSIGFDFLGEQQVKNVSTPVTSYRVAIGKVASDLGSAQSSRSDGRRIHRPPAHHPKGVAGLWSRYMSLPRPIAVALAFGAFLFLINAFDGFQEIWFHWPLAPLLLIAVLWSMIRHKP